MTYDTKIDKSGFEKGLNSITNSVKSGSTKIKDIVSALGITKIIGKAVSVINNSIDGAVSRIDTLNNFPKVMSNLGIASENSEKAVKKLSDGLQGIPTTLDDASLAVQRFTSKNGDVNKSVDLFLAVNNALLAGGASADIQSIAMEQLSQAYAKGKPDMVEWKSLQTAMPAQLKQVAQAFNMTSDELGEALRKGEISMDDFMDKIIELNKNGTGEFKSFEEQAKNSTGGIKTSIANAKTAITRGVAKIIETFDEALKSNGLGGIATVISKIGSTAEKVIKKVASLIPQVVEKAKEIYNWVINNQTVLKALVGVLASVTAGYLAYKAVLIAINAIQIAKNIIGTVSAFISLIPAIKSAKDAMLLLNMAFSANPIGLIIGIIVALIGILVVLYNKSETFRNSINKAFETVKNSIIKAWEKIKPSLEKLGETFRELLKKLQPVGEFLINVLGKAFEFLGNILAFVIDILAEVIAWFADYISSTIEFWTETVPNAIQEFINFISQLPQKIWEFLVNGWNNIVTFFTEGIPNFINSVIQWFQELPYKIGEFIGEILGSILKFGIDMGNWIVTELPILIQNIINWFAELPGRIWEWLCNVVNNIITWGQNMWNTAITAVSNMINGIINWFAQLPGRIWTWLVNTINNIINWGKDMANKGKAGAEDLFNNIVNVVKELPGKMLEIGKNIVEGIWNGIAGMGSWIAGKVSGFFSGIVDGAKKSLGIQSPSKVFRDKVGKFIPQGIAVGIEADTDKALKAIDTMNDDIVSKMQNAVAIETGSINAKAILQANKEQPMIITRDHTTTINNTQQFYSKNSTPYEEQKQAKQQLRRLAYGL